jgi:hypothetical protein
MVPPVELLKLFMELQRSAEIEELRSLVRRE